MSEQPRSGPAPHEVYAALLAHELRTPAATIQLYIHLLDNPRVLADAARTATYVRDLRGQAERLARVVTELTNYSDLLGGHPPRPARAGGTTPAETLGELAHGRPVRLELDADAGTAAVDPDRLRLAVDVLLENALAFRAPGTEVRVAGTLATDPGRLILRVSNQGESIPEELRGEIFEPFRQAEDYRVRKHQGLGLGLTVARRAAEDAGGSLVLEPGDPTTFRLELPLSEEPAAQAARQLVERAEQADRQALRAIADLRALRSLRRAYEHLLPEALGPQQTGPLPPIERSASVLLTDLRGFTALGERFADDPSGLLEVINEHLAAVVRAITACGGVVEKFVGDGVVATFGARSDQPDHSERAIAAALGVVGANNRLNRRRASAWGFHLEVAAGVAAGRVVVGGIGPPERWEMGVLGDPINVASRLVAQAEPGDILLAASAYRGLARRVRAELLGPTAVRGRAGRIPIYRISLGSAPRATA